MALFDRAKNMITSPKTEWAAISAEEPNAGTIVTGYALPLILISAAAAFVGYGLIGYSMLGFRVTGVSWGLYYAVTQILFGLAGIYITSYVVTALAPSFNSEKNSGRAMQLVVYSMTPVWVGGILSIYPALAWIGMLFGLYGLYLIYIGLPHTMKTPPEKVAIYMIVTILVLVVVYAIIGMALARPLMGIFGIGYDNLNWRM